MAQSKVALTLISLATAFAANGARAANNVTSNYTRPLSFEPNRGQTDKQVDYLAHGAGYSLFLSRGEAVMAFKDGGPVRMSPVGANAASVPEPIDQQPSKSNYFIGNKPEQWHTNVANYAKVRYRDVYPGVDLIYYGNQRQLEYDFVVGPGANATDILLDFEGAAKPALNREGELVMHTAAGELRWHKPVAYQEVDGNRRLVACSYTLKFDRFAFRLAPYDSATPLIIDPVLEYSTYLGGGGGEAGNAIAVDASGSAYVTGYTASTDFPVKSAFQSSYLGQSGSSNAFVTKFDSAGHLVYSTYLGGSGSSTYYVLVGDVGNGIAVDDAGNVYVTGSTGSLNFPIKNAYQSTQPGGGNPNVFITKFNSTGDQLVYSTFLGGSGQDTGCLGPPCGFGDVALGIAVDGSGNAYVAGSTVSSDFPLKNAFQTTRASGFVTELDASGNALVYSTYFPSAPSGIAVDGHGSAYITGSTRGGLPIENAFQPKPGGANSNAFVTKFAAGGNSLIYSTYLGGSGRTCRPSCGATGDSGSGIAVDGSGNAYVVGTVTSLDFPVKNAFQPKLEGRCYLCGNAFITKFDRAGTALVYSTYLGGGGDAGNAIALDPHANVYITGSTRSPNFPIKNAFQNKIACEADHPPCTEVFVAELEACGAGLVYSSYLGGYGNYIGGDQGTGIAVDKKGNAVITGTTHSIDFPTKNAFQDQIKTELGNAFVTKINAQ